MDKWNLENGKWNYLTLTKVETNPMAENVQYVL